MSYRIAVASSDEKYIDESFGGTTRFLIYEVTEKGHRKVEERIATAGNDDVRRGGHSRGSCGGGSGCGAGGAVDARIAMLLDCRCVVCSKIGFNVQKQLERRAISAFDISCTIEEALNKISVYFRRTDGCENRVI